MIQLPALWISFFLIHPQTQTILSQTISSFWKSTAATTTHKRTRNMTTTILHRGVLPFRTHASHENVQSESTRHLRTRHESNYISVYVWPHVISPWRLCSIMWCFILFLLYFIVEQNVLSVKYIIYLLEMQHAHK